jgi:dihydrofolate reductase
MRKIVLLEHISLDGYMAGPNGEMDWIRFDENMSEWGHQITDQCDAVIYGRMTFEMMAYYWPTAGEKPDASDHDKQHSQWVNGVERYVVSRSLRSAPWGNLGECTVVSDIGQFAKIRERPGKDIALIGSIDTAKSMIDAGLVDSLYLTLNPSILGGGRRLLETQHKIDLQLVDAQTLPSGVITCHYAMT